MNNGFSPRQVSGTPGDLFAAYITRFVTLGVLAYIAVTTTQSKEGVQQLKSDRDYDRTKILEIQDGMKKFATKDEMNSAEQRIKVELADQIKRAKMTVQP